MIKLTILGTPQPKQSARFRAVKSRDKVFVRSYQKKEVVENEKKIAFTAKTQLPKGFKPFSEALKVRVLFVFPPLKSFSKAKMNALATGVVMYKTTKPDLTDNLMKSTMDALNGIVFTDDAIISEVESKKIFGLIPRIELEFEALNKK
ncbi:RusA family crossover junction endodeoxyribonuclease [Elizabethkingia argentiflava]|uniref:RusA family crossover junction endodeoxyribonuclease n=1 Tax=Elizabethkingia argenteiflava TaxID=2681556 RepID=A0A845PRB1_9FLAO|nr:RusA family crossover junction endodeoxyribonuclease [Elizabethkingia argenteiflava]NAW50384.1 RusA family crossover junction endodeoxyribonuclease [Elizabethkingia argenteiflava]